MSKSVSNDALWEKLSEMEKKLNELSVMQKTLVPKEEPAGIKLDLKDVKNEIITSINGEIRILGLSNDSHFEANRKNIQQLCEDILKILKMVIRVRKHQKESVELPKPYFDFRLFKVRKTSFVIVMLGLLLLLLTLFCMKQQNDYTILNDEYYKQSVAVRDMQVEVDSLKIRSNK